MHRRLEATKTFTQETELGTSRKYYCGGTLIWHCSVRPDFHFHFSEILYRIKSDKLKMYVHLNSIIH